VDEFSLPEAIRIEGDSKLVEPSFETLEEDKQASLFEGDKRGPPNELLVAMLLIFSLRIF